MESTGSTPRGTANPPPPISPPATKTTLSTFATWRARAPVIRLVNAMIAQAVEGRASDIHIEPFEKEFRIRFRNRWRLFNQEQPPLRAEGGHHFATEADGDS